MSWRQSSTKTKASVQHWTETALNSAYSKTAVHYVIQHRYPPDSGSSHNVIWLWETQSQKAWHRLYFCYSLHFTVFNTLSSSVTYADLHSFINLLLDTRPPESESLIALLRTENQNDWSASRSHLGCHLQRQDEGRPHHHGLQCCPVLHPTFAASCTLTNHSSDVDGGLTVQRLHHHSYTLEMLLPQPL